MANPIKGLLEVFEDMVEVLLVLEIFLIEDLPCGAPSCSEACLFFGDDLLRLLLQYDLQHDFANAKRESIYTTFSSSKHMVTHQLRQSA